MYVYNKEKIDKRSCQSYINTILATSHNFITALLIIIYVCSLTFRCSTRTVRLRSKHFLLFASQHTPFSFVGEIRRPLGKVAINENDWPSLKHICFFCSGPTTAHIGLRSISIEKTVGRYLKLAFIVCICHWWNSPILAFNQALKWFIWEALCDENVNLRAGILLA